MTSLDTVQQGASAEAETLEPQSSPWVPSGKLGSFPGFRKKHIHCCCWSRALPARSSDCLSGGCAVTSTWE